MIKTSEVTLVSPKNDCVANFFACQEGELVFIHAVIADDSSVIENGVQHLHMRHSVDYTLRAFVMPRFHQWIDKSTGKPFGGRVKTFAA